MRTIDFVDSYFDAWNHRDAKGVADHFASNGCYVDIPENTRHSHDELTIRLDQFFARFPHRYELIGDVLTSDDTISFQYRMIPNGASSAGPQKTYRGAEFVTLQDDAALMITDYYDPIGAVGQRRTVSPPRQRKYAKSGLDDRQLNEYMARLEDVMHGGQIFLQADLTLPRLAEAVNCSVNHLSQVINAGFGTSFFDYLNLYRIEYARELLRCPDSKRHAILNIAYSVGFNSNSAFYAAFKKHVGQTPARYRRERLAATQ